VVARRFGSVLRGDGLVAAWALLDPEEVDVARTPGSLVESATEGWWYSAVLPDGRLSLIWFTDADLLPKGLGGDLGAWRALLATSVLTAARVESAAFGLADAPRTAAVGGVHRTEVWGPGWAAVGDAAGARDPLSSHGMSVALWGGLTVAEALPAALVGDTAGLTEYGQTLARARQRYEAERTEVYGSERRFDTPFWRRRRPPSQPE
jgi:2-polyprenyl-6-methoxyphenol hydroxylase-like FAD-dependent oxidoreductase